MTDALRTAVIVVNWNGAAETRACLRALDAIRVEWSECFVVDNGSEDGSDASVAAPFAGVRWIDAGANLGYAGGNNLGIRAALDAGACWVLILNNDAIARPGSIAELRRALERDPRLGIVGPQVRRSGGSGRFWYAGGRVARSPFRSRYVAVEPSSDEPFAVDYVPGCALMASREALEATRGFDESFFLTWEEVDLCERARRAGLRSMIVPRASVEHVGSASFAGLFSPLYSYYYYRNMLLYARRHFPPSERPRAYADTLRLAWRRAQAVRPPRERRRVAAATALGVLHFAAGRLGAAPRRYTRRVLEARGVRRAEAALERS